MKKTGVEFGKVNVSESEDEEEDENVVKTNDMGYQQTLMYGQYRKSLAEDIKQEAQRLKLVEKLRKKELRRRHFEDDLKNKNAFTRKVSSLSAWLWRHSFAKWGGSDWVFLALLGVIMALVSFAMDYTIAICNNARLWLVQDLVGNIYLQFLLWVSLPTFLILFSTGFVHILAPQAIGSGIPEMKVILRGVVLKEYLTFKTLVAKIIGLTATLGSGMPLGKEGPFVHIASIVAALLSKLCTSFQGIYGNESRKSEMLGAACAVGVACCFGAPIGGVLFSIEVTSVYFAVRNYWRGFFSAVVGAIVFRLLSIWFQDEDTIVALFRTGFPIEFPYDPQELFVFAAIGTFCGIGGSLYVFLHRKYVLWMRGNKQLSRFLQKNRFIYPLIISSLISALSFPRGLGMFTASASTTHEQVVTLFSNFTWTRQVDEMSVLEYEHIKHWRDPYSNSVFVSLSVYIVTTFFLSILASTLPVPSGVLIPTFKIGAAFGRLVGEAMHVWFPDGVRYGDQLSFIMPGGYATVGAAAFSGAVTHTISISVIVFELTGQITHCVPVLVAVLISNAIASFLQPSCYDSIILIKKLPYLPDIVPSSTGGYNSFVEDFMLSIGDVHYIWYGMTYSQLRDVLRQGRKLKGFPLVDNPDHMVLLGSIRRQELISAIENHIGQDRRLAELRVRRLEAERAKRKSEQEERIKSLSLAFDKMEEDNNDNDVNTGPADPGARRPSRFAVSAVKSQNDVASNSTETLPKQVKGILKQSNTDSSKTVHESSPSPSPYNTFVSTADRWRHTITNITNLFTTSEYTLNGGQSRKRLNTLDMSTEEQRQWEEEEMQKPVNFAQLKIDPAPFQLPEKSSLLKVHSLFSMLGLNHAYVTTIGRLIGVVGLKELRKAIEEVNHGHGIVKGRNSKELSRRDIEDVDVTDETVVTVDQEDGNTVKSIDSVNEGSSLMSNEDLQDD